MDAAIFLEFLPGASGNVLSSMAIFWSIGNLIARYVLVPGVPCRPNDANQTVHWPGGSSPTSRARTQAPAPKKTTGAGDTSC